MTYTSVSLITSDGPPLCMNDVLESQGLKRACVSKVKNSNEIYTEHIWMSVPIIQAYASLDIC